MSFRACQFSSVHWGVSCETQPCCRENAVFGFPCPIRSTQVSFPFYEVLKLSSRKLGVHDFFNDVLFAVIGYDWWWGVGELLRWEFCGDEGGEVLLVESSVHLFPCRRELETVRGLPHLLVDDEGAVSFVVKFFDWSVSGYIGSF